MDKAYNISIMVISIKDSISMVCHKDMGNILGAINLTTKENLNKDWDLGLDAGKKIKLKIVSLIEVTMWWI